MGPDALDFWLGTWTATWESGGCWHFVGTLTDEGTIFATPDPVDEDQAYKRMVFSDVERDAFHWRWESSPDGTAWIERWAIDYRRAR